METTSRISIVIPAYNEAERLPTFLRSITAYHTEKPDSISEVLIVDDGSSDTTIADAEAIKQELPQLRVIAHEKNRGKGAAVQPGVLAATGDNIIFMDADGATAIDQLPKMQQALATAQIGVGNRWMRGADTERSSLLRKLSGFVYRSYMKLFGLGDIDTMCGFKGYHRDVAQELFSDLQEERWLFDTEIAYKAVQASYTIHNFPIRWRSMDGSKLDTRTLLKTALQIWPLIRSLKRNGR